MSHEILERLLGSIDGEPDVRELRVCSFFTAVASRGVGLASTLRHVRHTRPGHPVRDAGELLPCSAGALAGLARSEHLLEASIGLAALNSLIEVDLDACVDLNAGELLAERGRGRRVAVVGDFPFVKRLRQVAGELWVFELGDRAGPEHQRPDQMSTLLPEVEVAAISSTTLLNHTLDGILAELHPECYTVLLGPSTPMAPLLFDQGIDALCGSVVVDPERVLACLSQGATFRQVDGIRHVTAVTGGYPTA